MGDMSVPPGFTRLTSFTLQRVERDTSVAALVQSMEYACGEGDKVRKLLQHKPWVNYSGVCTISDSEDDDMPDQSLPNGVMADVAVIGTSFQPQHEQSPSGQMSSPGESSRAGGTAAAMSANNMPAQQLNLPRFVEVGEERRHTIEILEYGKVMPDELWSTRCEIFPKGFRSRACYWSVMEPNKQCAYISEILDAGLVGPLFMVSVEGNPSEVFVHVNPKRCWDLVVEKVNTINKIFYQENKKRGRPANPFQAEKFGSINGLQMFGLRESTVLKDLEGLDIERKSKFCRLKDQIEEEEERDPEVQHHNPLDRTAAPNAPAGSPSLVLQKLVKKANPEELRALETVLRDTSSSNNVRQEVILLLTEETRSRQH